MSVVVTVAVFVIWPAFFGVTLISTVACSPASIAPRSQVTVLPCSSQLPPICEVVAETKSSDESSLSVTLTPLAESGPALATVSV